MVTPKRHITMYKINNWYIGILLLLVIVTGVIAIYYFDEAEFVLSNQGATAEYIKTERLSSLFYHLSFYPGIVILLLEIQRLLICIPNIIILFFKKDYFSIQKYIVTTLSSVSVSFITILAMYRIHEFTH